MKLTVFAASTALAVAFAAPAHADPPAPLQCKVTGGFNTTVCRYPDGHVTVCDALTGCHPVWEQIAPGFWDQP
jgi:hypothetical protein